MSHPIDPLDPSQESESASSASTPADPRQEKIAAVEQMEEATRSDDPELASAVRRERDSHEQVYYEGSPMLRGELGTLLLWSAIGLVILLTPILVRSFTNMSVAWWAIGGGILIGLGCFMVPSLLVRRNYYKVTNYRIDFEHGLLFKEWDTLELWHVEDVGLRQSPIDRVLRVGNIKIVSSDSTTPTLVLRSVHEPRKLYEMIKERIIAVKRQRGVVKLDI